MNEPDFISPRTLREIAEDAEVSTSSALWDYPGCLHSAAETIDYLVNTLRLAHNADDKDRGEIISKVIKQYTDQVG